MVWETIAEQLRARLPGSLTKSACRQRARRAPVAGARVEQFCASCGETFVRPAIAMRDFVERLPAIELSTTESGQVGSLAGVDRLGRGADH